MTPGGWSIIGRGYVTRTLAHLGRHPMVGSQPHSIWACGDLRADVCLHAPLDDGLRQSHESAQGHHSGKGEVAAILTRVDDDLAVIYQPRGTARRDNVRPTENVVISHEARTVRGPSGPPHHIDGKLRSRSLARASPWQMRSTPPPPGCERPSSGWLRTSGCARCPRIDLDAPRVLTRCRCRRPGPGPRARAPREGWRLRPMPSGRGPGLPLASRGRPGCP